MASLATRRQLVFWEELGIDHESHPVGCEAFPEVLDPKFLIWGPDRRLYKHGLIRMYCRESETFFYAIAHNLVLLESNLCVLLSRLSPGKGEAQDDYDVPQKLEALPFEDIENSRPDVPANSTIRSTSDLSTVCAGAGPFALDPAEPASIALIDYGSSAIKSAVIIKSPKDGKWYYYETFEECHGPAQRAGCASVANPASQAQHPVKLYPVPTQQFIRSFKKLHFGCIDNSLSEPYPEIWNSLCEQGWTLQSLVEKFWQEQLRQLRIMIRSSYSKWRQEHDLPEDSDEFFRKLLDNIVVSHPDSIGSQTIYLFLCAMNRMSIKIGESWYYPQFSTESEGSSNLAFIGEGEGDGEGSSRKHTVMIDCGGSDTSVGVWSPPDPDGHRPPVGNKAVEKGGDDLEQRCIELVRRRYGLEVDSAAQLRESLSNYELDGDLAFRLTGQFVKITEQEMRTVVLPPLLDPVKKALDTFKEQLPRDFTVRYLGGVLRYPCLQIAIREWMKAEMIDPDVRVSNRSVVRGLAAVSKPASTEDKQGVLDTSTMCAIQFAYEQKRHRGRPRLERLLQPLPQRTGTFRGYLEFSANVPENFTILTFPASTDLGDPVELDEDTPPPICDVDSKVYRIPAATTPHIYTFELQDPSILDYRLTFKLTRKPAEFYPEKFKLAEVKYRSGVTGRAYQEREGVYKCTGRKTMIHFRPPLTAKRALDARYPESTVVDDTAPKRRKRKRTSTASSRPQAAALTMSKEPKLSKKRARAIADELVDCEDGDTIVVEQNSIWL